MEEEKKLYPFRFCGLEDKYLWGSEEFKLADLGYRDSLVRDGWLAANSIGEVMDMYMDRVVGDNVFEFWGRQFPVCVKTVDVKGRLPLQVHPDDETAAQRYDFLGKEKLWYVRRVGKDARLAIGFRKDTDASEVYSKCLDGSIEDILNVVAPHAGQWFHIAPGTPHTASGDISLVEISESSPLDFCLCGWGDEVSEEEFDPALSLIEALDFISYGKYRSDEDACRHADDAGTNLLDLPQFNVSRIDLKDAMHVYSEKFDSFVLYFCLEGSASVQISVLDRTAAFAFSKGELILVPAECPDFNLVSESGRTSLLEITIPYRSDKDLYINPAVEATLPEEEE